MEGCLKKIAKLSEDFYVIPKETLIKRAHYEEYLNYTHVISNGYEVRQEGKLKNKFSLRH